MRSMLRKSCLRPHVRINMRLSKMDYIVEKAGNVMKGNKRLEFLKSIRLPSEETNNEKSRQGTQSKQVHNMIRQEEYDLQKELERRFEELFGTTFED